MRKITFFFAMLLMCISAARVSAQSLEDYGAVPLITAGMFESPFSDSAEGTNIDALCDGDPSTFWHSDWHGAVEGDFHWLQINFTEPISGDFVLYMLRRSSANYDHPTAITIEGSNDGESWAEITQVNYGFAGKGTAELSSAWNIAEPVSKLRLTVTDCAPADPGFRKYWHAAEIQFYHADDDGLIIYALNNILTQYDAYVWGETMDIGNMPGQYSNTEAWEAFLADLDYINQYVNGEIPEKLTADQAEELIARLEANYQAVLDSKVPLGLQESGYYFVAAALEYYAGTAKLDENGDPVLNEFGEPVYETIYPTKAMYANGNTLAWKTLDSTDYNFLFRLDYNAETDAYKFYNCATNGRVNTVAQSTAVTLDETLDPTASEVVFTLSHWDAEKDRYIIFISRADQVGEPYPYLHQNGHNDGAGTENTVVGWTDAAASGWYLIRVADADAEALIAIGDPLRDREVMLKAVADMKSEGSAALKIARDVQTTIDFEQPLISDVSQFSSPWTESSEGSIEALLDGDASTFWHSAWSGGEVPVGTHYLQVELADPEAVQSAVITMTRRNGVNNDHITKWGVYGTNENDADSETKIAKEACTFLAEINTPFTSNDETITSEPFDTKGFKYLRFYINDTACPGVGTASRGYGHASEFQLYPAVNIESATSQKNMLGALYTDLEAAIAAVPTTEDDITVDHYSALKAAYDAFMAKYVDPMPLRTAMANAQTNANTMVVGTLPGYWSEGAAADLTGAIATAAAYDAAGVYDAAKSEEMIALLSTESKNFFAKANKVNPGKWYYIHMAAEAQYAQYGWATNNMVDTTTGLGNLYGKYVTAATINQPEGDGNDYITPLGFMDVREGTSMHFIEEVPGDGGQFRFIAVGDTAYVLQNKATGLFVHCVGADNDNVTLELTPTIFKPAAIGYGQMLITGNSLAGASVTNLHAKLRGHKLVTWRDSAIGSNSGLFVEEAGDVDLDNLNNTFIRNVRSGQIYAQCYPVSVSAELGCMYSVAGTYTEGEKNYVALNEIEMAEAGKPYIYIHGEPGDWVVPAEGEEVMTEEVLFNGGNEVVAQADSINGLVGTFSTFAVEKGTTIFADNAAKATTAASTNVEANNAFLRFGWTEVEPGEGDLIIEISGDVTVTAIESVLNKVAKTGNVYDLNGRLVRTNATLNDVKALGRGMYILNGMKIRVK